MAITTPNKLINQFFLCKNDIFPYLMEYFNATTDMSFTYIPIDKTSKMPLNRDNGDHYTMVFEEKNETNGFADLGIGFLNKDKESESKFIKVVHLNSLHRFNIDSNLFTFDENKKNLYYVFYSDVEYTKAENKRFAIIPAETLFLFFETLNIHTENQTIDLITMKDTLEILGKYEIIDVDKNYIDHLDKGTQTNISIKQKNCINTLNADWYSSTNPKKLGIAFSRTHYGNQYTLFNLTKGKIYNVRDVHALKNFCKLYGITETNIKEISKKCRYQELMVEGKIPERYSANIYTSENNEEWIITNRQKDESEIDSNFVLIDKIKQILLALYENSPKWSKKLKSKLKVFLSNIDKFCKHLKKVFIKVMNVVISTLFKEDFSSDYIFNNLRFAKLFKYNKTPNI